MKKLLPIVILLFATSVYGQLTFPALVIVDKAIIRAKPDKQSKVLEELENGKQVIVLSKTHQNGWYSAMTSDFESGWIHGNNIAFQERELKYRSVYGGWKSLTATATSLDGVTYSYKQMDRRYDTVEGWLKVEPMFPTTFIKKNKLPTTFSYFLEFMSLDCERKRISITRTVAYSADDAIINTPRRLSDFVFYDPVVPNSVGENIWKKLCK